MPEYNSEKIFALGEPSPEEIRRQEIEDSLNYNLQLRRKQGIDPMPVIIGFSHIYNTYNSVERERWQKFGFARMLLRSYR